MEGGGGDGPSTAIATLNQQRHELSQFFYYDLDKSNPYVHYRWTGTFVLAFVYALRSYSLQGFYIVSYVLGIYILNLLIEFLSPLFDPKLEQSDGPLLPTKGYAITKAFCIAFLMTFFSMFDVPVFWPILLFYWIVLFVLTTKHQIMNMIKYKYIQFDIGKQTYRGENPAYSCRDPRAD